MDECWVECRVRGRRLGRWNVSGDSSLHTHFVLFPFFTYVTIVKDASFYVSAVRTYLRMHTAVEKSQRNETSVAWMSVAIPIFAPTLHYVLYFPQFFTNTIIAETTRRIGSIFTFAFLSIWACEHLNMWTCDYFFFSVIPNSAITLKYHLWSNSRTNYPIQSIIIPYPSHIK